MIGRWFSSGGITTEGLTKPGHGNRKIPSEKKGPVKLLLHTGEDSVRDWALIGASLSHFRVTARLGSGGMGEVWRATDTTLDREVALKFLPEDFARDPERLARFEREAKLLASLNHPNIATLYGLETAALTETGAETMFLCMELVQGEDLAQRLESGPIAIDEAVELALQIAEGLSAAHEHGIVHRDLKPANVMITPDGVAKILDFGLARAWSVDEGDTSLSMSPTITKDATAAGVVLGTAAYMSPEQARGKGVDRRSDIWAFGVVLWEMLTGHTLFEGETVSDILAGVLRADPDWEELPAGTTPALRRLLKRCLNRDPRSRLHDIADARLELETSTTEALGEFSGEQTLGRDRGSRRWLPWAVAAIIAALLVFSHIVLPNKPVPIPPIVATIPLPADIVPFYGSDFEGSFAVSPDGRSLVFSGASKDRDAQLWLRSLGSAEVVPLPGTDRGLYPFWSPDSRWIAFFADEKLKKVGLAGSPPQTLCDAPDGRPGSWNDDDVLLFSPNTITGIYRVSASGGEPQQVTELDSDLGETTHRWASFLPDGRHFLFLAGGHDLRRDAAANALYVGDLESEQRTQLMALRSPALFDCGHLLFVRNGVLIAQPFDPARLEFTGDPVSVASEVAYDPGYFQARFSVAHGVVVYRREDQAMGAGLAWLGRSGMPLEQHGGSPLPEIAPAPEDFVSDMPAALSPDDTRCMCILENGRTGTWELWIAELENGLWTKFSQTQQQEMFPVWSPDGRQVVFTRARLGQPEFEFVVARADGSSSKRVLRLTDRYGYPTDWSRDGRFLLYTQHPTLGLAHQADIWVLPMDGSDQKPFPYLQTDHGEVGGWFSPNGEWVLYISDETGVQQAYVRPFPDPGAKHQVTNEAAVWGWWRTPKEILLLSPDGTISAVEVSTSTGIFRSGASQKLIDIRPIVVGEPSHDGSRFIVAFVSESTRSGQFSLLVNWKATLDRY
jgi:serine/threonine protein kinase/Tol biopolymer transport system component